MSRFSGYTAGVVLAIVPAFAMAHGPQIQITRDNDKITTRAVVADSPYTTLTSPKSLYVIPLVDLDGVWYSRPNNQSSATIPGAPEFLSGPGIAFGYDQIDGGVRAFMPGSNFALNILDGLKWWDGSAFVDGGAEQIQAFRGSPASPSFSATTNDAALPSSIPFASISATYDSDAHGTINYRLLGDGLSPLSPSDDGIYLLRLQLSSTEAGLASSSPFSFLLHKNAEMSDLTAAVQALNVDLSQVQFVPEPGACVLAGIAGVLVLGVCSFSRRREYR